MRLPGAITGISGERAELQAMFLHDSSPSTLLDIGCGDGTFLASMRERGWTVSGVDFDAEAIANAKRKFGLNLCVGSLASCGFQEQSFAAITLSHVIEHVPDPEDMIRLVYRLLKPGGRLVVTTPNALSWGHRTYGHNWFGLDAPRHLQIFNPSNLGLMLKKAQLDVVSARSTAARADVFIGASEAILRSGQERLVHTPNVSLLRTTKAIRGQFKEHFLLRSDPQAGEEVVVIATRA